MPGSGPWSCAPVRVTTGTRGGYERFEPADTAFLRGLAEYLGDPSSPDFLYLDALHLRGMGGTPAATELLRDWLAQGRYRFVARSDARGYYANIQHHKLLALLGDRGVSRPVRDAVLSLCQRTVVRDGIWEEPCQRGIPLGCPLSPVLGALYLAPLDEAISRLPGVRYLRFMDDWVILAESRWKLRRALRAVRRVLDDLGLEPHPEKTSIGRVERGFDFLGLRWDAADEDFRAPAPRPAAVSLSRMREKLRDHLSHAARLYEQGALQDLGDTGRYLIHWLRRQKGVGVAPPDALAALRSALRDEEAACRTVAPRGATSARERNRGAGADLLSVGITWSFVQALVAWSYRGQPCIRVGVPSPVQHIQNETHPPSIARCSSHAALPPCAA